MSKKKKIRPEPASLGLPKLGVETHAHLDLEELLPELPDVLARAAAAGIAVIGNVFLGPDAYERGRHLFDGQDAVSVFFILGQHPQLADAVTPDSLAATEAAFKSDSRIRAMGEIGLDYHFADCPPAELQRSVLRDQLALARDLDVPVVIHARDAAEETAGILLDMGFRDRPVLWHCFGGDIALANALVEHGWHLSIPGPVTYSSNTAVMEAVAQAPLDRLVVETDCPYLAPEPYRGKRNEPAYIVFTAQKVAALKGMETADLWRETARNARRFFKLDDVL